MMMNIIIIGTAVFPIHTSLMIAKSPILALGAPGAAPNPPHRLVSPGKASSQILCPIVDSVADRRVYCSVWGFGIWGSRNFREPSGTVECHVFRRRPGLDN